MVSSRELFLGAGLAPCLVALARVGEPSLQASLLLSLGVSLFGFFTTRALIPLLKPYTIRSNLFGYDINKKGTSW